ncbi:glycosyltransferase family 2 protein [Candidatus Magnetomonas plexicatena]|uniref:glycosyltransferase family 2 protein n=1 Tax=Candidatus Magnetomonas plexicatena TaxID=2552947 RepID=UPI001C75A5E4|nr:glycosyltransferase [Nitrospirales bacterium LBB_01]
MIPLFSVVIDTYNYGSYLEQAIESVLNQSFPLKDVEIIVVDDGSTDDTPMRVKRFKDAITYIYKENGGQASALNAGISHVKGSIVSLLDADDFWHKDKLKVVAEHFEKFNDVDIINHNLSILDENGGNEYLWNQDEGDVAFRLYNPEDYLRGVLIPVAPTSGNSFRIDCLKKALPIPLSYRVCADSYLHTVLPLVARNILYIPKSLGGYRIHGKNCWSNHDTFTIERIIEKESLNLQDLQKWMDNMAINNRLIENKMQMAINRKKIFFYNGSGQKLKALKQAILYKDFAHINPPLSYRLLKRIFVLASAVVPPDVYHEICERSYFLYVWMMKKFWKNLKYAPILNKIANNKVYSSKKK